MRGVKGTGLNPDRYTREPASGCWLWLGGIDAKGYPCASVNGKTARAHRAMYESKNGPLRPGLTLDHFRLNPGPRKAPCSKRCVNPAHLEPVTARVNVLRGDTPAARNAAKTFCPVGHPYSTENTYHGSGGHGRQCRACSRERATRKRERKRNER